MVAYKAPSFSERANAARAGEIGIGIAWASILAMPYAILASHLPQKKLGVYMGRSMSSLWCRNCLLRP